jgi:hypothetical protein
MSAKTGQQRPEYGCLLNALLVVALFIVLATLTLIIYAVILPLASTPNNSLPQSASAPEVVVLPTPTIALPTATPVLPTAIPIATPTAIPILPTAIPVLPLRLEWMALPFDQICGNNATLTAIQQEALATTMIGKKAVGWIGRVYNVERDGDSYKVLVDMTDDVIAASDIELLGVSLEIAIRLNVNQVITFDGTVHTIGVFREDICHPFYIVDALIFL